MSGIGDPGDRSHDRNITGRRDSEIQIATEILDPGIRRLSPPPWLWVLLLIPLAGILLVRLADLTGDQGFSNAVSFLLAAVVTILAASWFLFSSSYSRRLRQTLALASLVLVLGFLAMFRVESFSGSLIPIIGWRFAERGFLPTQFSGIGSTRPSSTIVLRPTAVDFPGFLGPGRSAAVEHIRLARDWQTEPPQLLWRQPIGAGWSAFAVVNGYAVTMEQRQDQQLVTAYLAETGELLWAHASVGRFEHVLGGIGPRSTPTIDDGYVYALGVGGHLWCLDGATGELVWEKDLLKEYGVTAGQEIANIQYGRSSSPLIVGDLVVIPGGGNKDGRLASLVAYDKRTGELVWEAGGRQISHASPRLATLAGVPQILIVNEDTFSGHDPRTGRRLWEHPWPGVTSANASVSQAVPVSPDRVFVSKGYGGGASVIQLLPLGDGTFDARELWHNNRVLRTKLTNVVIKDGYVYGLSEGILECVDLETGRRVWKHGRYHHGQILRVGELLLVLSEDGEVVLVELTREEPDKVLSRFQAIEGKTWNNIALYGDILLVRNAQEAAAYRLPLRSRPAV